jgi:hypothetical protein
VSGSALLYALAPATRAAPDLAVVTELHRRYAPLLYALARQHFQDDPELHVQEALCFLIGQAHCHARSPLEAQLWVVAMAIQCWTVQKIQPSTPLLAS